MIKLDDGTEVKTGLLVPDARPERLLSWSEKARILGPEEAARILSHRSRVKARDRFPADWVYRQQNNDCNGQACAKALRRARVLAGLDDVDLSGEFLYAAINGGRDQGSMLDDGAEAMERLGVAPSSLVRAGLWRWSEVSAAAREAASRFRLFECHRIDSQAELISALALGFVCVVAVHVNSSFSELDQRGVVPPSRQGRGNHAVLVDDCARLADGWLFDMVNSWGTRWGQQGRGWISWKMHLERTTQFHAFFAIRASRPDPLADNLPDREETKYG